MSQTSVPNLGAVAAKYVINNDNSTDSITCYGKETMSLEQLEKALRKHFRENAEQKSSEVKSILDTSSQVAKKAMASNPLVVASKQGDKTATQHLAAAANSVSGAAQALGDTIQKNAADIFEQATSTAQNAVANLTKQANQTAETAASAVANAANDLKTQAQSLQGNASLKSKAPGLNVDNVNPTVGDATPMPLRNTVSNTLATKAPAPIMSGDSDKPMSIANSVNPSMTGGKRKRKSRRKHKKKMRKTRKKKAHKKSHKKRGRKKRGRKTKKR
jgi:hypothetical protein